MKFTFSGGIAVRLAAAGGEAVLEVEDTGVGIPPEAQAGLFQRFPRVAGAAARSFEGSGIGLALVADLAALHGGRVGLRSAPGAGARSLSPSRSGPRTCPRPRWRAPSADGDAGRYARGYLAEALRWTARDGAGPSAASGTPDSGATANRVPAADAVVPGQAGARTAGTGRRPSVLVVDDNADMRDYVAGLLVADYEVVVAADGEEAPRAGPLAARPTWC